MVAFKDFEQEKSWTMRRPPSTSPHELATITGSHRFPSSSNVASQSTLHSQETATSCIKDKATRSTKSSLRVSFDMEATSIHFVDRVKDMPTQEVDATWYDRSELAYIRSQNNLAASFMVAGLTNPELRGHCFRGLEYRDSIVGNRRTEILTKSLAVVLIEQERQIEENFTDQDMIASVYARYTKKCHEHACRIAKRDEEVAMSIHCGKSLSLKPGNFSPRKEDTVSASDTYDYSIDMTAEDDDISELSDNADRDDLSFNSDFSARRFLLRVKGFLRKKI